MVKQGVPASARGSGSGACSFLIVGAGAIGGIYAAHLAKVATVAVLDTDAAHVGAIREHGLAVIGVTETVAAIEAATEVAAYSGRSFDFVIVAVKSGHTRSALESLLPRLAGRPALLSLQNGQGNIEVMAELTDAELIHGLTWEAGELEEPGRIRHLIHGPKAHIGPARGPMAVAVRLAAELESAGLPTEAVADPRGAIWTKFIFNCAMNPISALLQGIPEAKYACEDTWELLSAAVDEGRMVAEREGIRLDGDPLDLLREVRAGSRPMPRHPGSMAQDIARGRTTEIEALTGYMLRKARVHNIVAPRTETLYRLIKGLEFGLAQSSGRPR